MKAPNYKRIYTDLISTDHPEKMDQCKHILSKDELAAIDVLNLDKILFGSLSEESQKHRSYDEETVIYILRYQKNYNLNNSQLAAHFNLSRNTVRKWIVHHKHKL